MKSVTLEVTERSDRGKNRAKALRKTGFIPSVVYGHAQNSTAVTVELSKLKKVLKTDTGRNVIINLEIKDAAGKVTGIEVMPYQFDFDYIKNEIIHVDFLEVTDKVKVKTIVHIEIAGVAPGVKMGGMLAQQMDKLHILAVPNKIPNHITIDISNLGLGQSFRVEDIQAVDGVQILDNPKNSVIGVEVPRGQKAEDTAAAAAPAGKAAPAAKPASK